MKDKNISKLSSLILIGFLSVITAACNFPDRFYLDSDITQSSDNSLVKGYPVDPLFSEFYESLGGVDTLGPVISPLFELRDSKYQYVQAGLMEFNPVTTDSDSFNLVPLGIMLGIAEPPIPDPGKPDDYYVNGHIIYPPFVSLYETMGKSLYVGKPLTEARYDPENRRIVQYFEKLGFSQLEDDPSGKVNLLAYGVLNCKLACLPQPFEANIIINTPSLSEPFASTRAFLGSDFIGLTLTQPYLANDGKMEVVFQNVVMVTDNESPVEKSALEYPFQTWLPLIEKIQPEDLENETMQVGPQTLIPYAAYGSGESSKKVSLRPIVNMIGIQTQPPIARRNDPLFIFYRVQGEKGYHVPVYFDAYIKQYGGIDLVGLPITEVFQLGDGRFRQCFTNLCLDFDMNASDSEKLRVAPLGLEYKARFYQTGNPTFIVDAADQIDITVAEKEQIVPPNSSQVINIRVMIDGVPLGNQKLVLFLTNPDNQRQVFNLKPTDEQGRTSIKLPPIAAPNITIIKYQVCPEGANDIMNCIEDNYSIWEYP